MGFFCLNWVSKYFGLIDVNKNLRNCAFMCTDKSQLFGRLRSGGSQFEAVQVNSSQDSHLQNNQSKIDRRCGASQSTCFESAFASVKP
jgi:hypothetical protein